jgi:hypothetical protein
MKAGCDHSKDIVLFTFEGLLPDNSYSNLLSPTLFRRIVFKFQPSPEPKVESPPPKSLLS